MTADEIITLENKLTAAKDSYLRRYGWERTCNTPGSFWMWVRDFADVDAQREKHYRPPGSPFMSFGRIMADRDTAVMMTQRVLDHEPTEQED